MASEVIMPKLGMAMSEGVLVKWLKAEGEPVQEGEAIAEIETDKALVEIDAPATGILRGIHVQPGETVPVGTVLAYILEDGEALPSAATNKTEDGGRGEAVVVKSPGTAVSAPSDVPAGEGGQPASEPAVAEEKQLTGTRLTPAARRLARERGVDLAEIAVAFPGRRVGRDELLAWMESRRGNSATAAATSAETVEGVDPATRAEAVQSQSEKPSGSESPIRKPVTSMRATIARRMIESLRESAQVTLTTQVNVDALVRFRAEVAPVFEAEYGVRLTYTDFLVKAVAKAVQAVPQVNARWEGDAITFFPWVHVGVAVALEEGLVVPVVRHAESASLVEISRRLRDLRERARTGKLTPDELTGSTISISNLGMEGIDAFTPILNPPEVAILGVGRIRQVPQQVDGEWRPVHEMTLSLTIDHRVVDGAPGAKFLGRIAELLARPVLLVGNT